MYQYLALIVKSGRKYIVSKTYFFGVSRKNLNSYLTLEKR